MILGLLDLWQLAKGEATGASQVVTLFTFCSLSIFNFTPGLGISSTS
jgi:hypothetical protein